MADFQVAYQIVHGNEGGYANHPSDKGKETYMGISRRWHPDWPGWIAVDAYKAANGRPKNGQFLNVSGLLDDVIAFYKSRWNDIHGSQIKSQAVANIIYDFATGTGSAVRVVQGVLVQLGYALSLDNAIGPQTLAAINAAEPAQLHNAIKAARLAYVKQLVVKYPDQAVFLGTWTRRINSFVDLQKKTSVPLSRAA
jgi:lysozyme family protein